MEVRPYTGLGGSEKTVAVEPRGPELAWACCARVLCSLHPLGVPAPSGLVGRSPSSLRGCEHSGNAVGTAGTA